MLQQRPNNHKCSPTQNLFKKAQIYWSMEGKEKQEKARLFRMFEKSAYARDCARGIVYAMILEANSGERIKRRMILLCINVHLNYARD